MRLLIDSHVAIWWLAGDHSLGPESAAAIAKADEVRFSVVTPWELGIKKSLGKIDFPGSLATELEGCGFMPLDINVSHVEIACALPAHHRDPFDRMLIGQALAEQLTIVTADRQFDAYAADLLPARK